MTETESALLELMRSFAIDHYDPRTGTWQVDDQYPNLMWSCETCNRLKSDFSSPPAAVAAGIRLVKIDVEHPDDHIALRGNALVAKTKAGETTIELLSLAERSDLKALRRLRADLGASGQLVRNGLRALNSATANLDKLNPRARARLRDLLRRYARVELDTALALEVLAAQAGRHTSLDPPGPEAAFRAKGRRKWLDAQQALYPGVWRKRGHVASTPADSSNG